MSEAAEDGDGDLSAKLLVAAPKLTDPNFARSVVLVLDHGEHGALGVVLNRVTGAPVSEILDPWEDQASLVPPAVMFAGGPVSLNAVIGVARPLGVTPSGEADERWRPILGSIATIDLSLPPAAQPVALDGVRLFAGYAGWGPDQLETELAEEAWYVLGADPSDIFTERPSHLWHDVLRRQEGDLSLLAGYPPHPSVN